MSFILKPVDTVESITREDFKKNYLDKKKPLIIKGLTKDWPAREKWSTDYFKEIAGDIEVKLVDNSKADPTKVINASIGSMKFGDYLDLIKREPTQLRIFFFNLFNGNFKITFLNLNLRNLSFRYQFNEFFYFF